MINLPINGERVKIRYFEVKDYPSFLSFMLNEKSTKYLMFAEEQKTEEGAKGLFDFVVASYNTNDHIHSYAIVDEKSDIYIGSCGLSPYGDGIVECYFSINEDFLGNNFATDALKLMIQSLSDSCEVRAYCSPENSAAHAVLLKSGFANKGLSLHEHFKTEGCLFVYKK